MLQKSSNMSQNASQNRPRRPPEPSAEPGWRLEPSKIASGGLWHDRNMFFAFQGTFLNDLGRLLGACHEGSAAGARPVKAILADWARQAKTRTVPNTLSPQAVVGGWLRPCRRPLFALRGLIVWSASLLIFDRRPRGAN